MELTVIPIIVRTLGTITKKVENMLSEPEIRESSRPRHS